MLLPPRYGTRRRPERPTSGAAWALAAEQMGMRLMPHQRHVLDVAGELIPDPDTGELVHAYTDIIVSKPRRAGKTFVVLPRLVGQCVFNRRQRAWYTAQDRAAAALVLKDEWLPWFDPDTAIGQLVRPRIANGSEALEVKRLHSAARLFAPLPTALHSAAGDVIVFDECWAHSRERGGELLVAARPLMATRPGAQLWRVSAAGDIDSTWWADTLDEGRAAVAADTGTGVCHLEWSADADDIDPHDRDTWRATHPAVRGPDNPDGTVPLSFLEAEYDRDPQQFLRLYLNITDRAGVTGAPIDPGLWSSLETKPTQRTAVIALGVDSAPFQSATSIVACTSSDGMSVLELIDHQPDQAWAVDRVRHLVDTWPVHVVAIAANGPARALAEPLEAAGVPVELAAGPDVSAAATQLVQAVRTSTVRHVPAESLDVAVRVARRRNHGDGSWSFGRRDAEEAEAGADVSPLIAASLARWAHPGTFYDPSASGIA